MARSVMNHPTAMVALGAGVALSAWMIYNLRTRKHYARVVKSNRGISPSGKSVDSGEKRLVVYFGSQTGTSETFASDLANNASDRGLKCEVRDLDEFDEAMFANERYVIFVQSTYGEGDPTDSSLEFFKWLKDADESCLKKMRYTVFGCGNRLYTEFNKAGKDIDQHIKRLGGKRMAPIGMGDDDGDVEDDFSRWQETIWDPICQLILGNVDSAAGNATPKYKVPPLVLCMNADGQALPKDRSVLKEGNDTLAKWIFQSYDVPVANIRELCQQHDEKKSTVHMDVDISRSRLLYNTADNAEILPRNPEHVVQKFATLLQCEHQLEHFIGWTRNPTSDKPFAKSPFPTPCTVRTALEQFSDLLTLPGKNALTQFALKLENPQPLVDFLHSAEFKSMTRAHVSFLEFWEAFFPSLKIDLGTFLQLCPRPKMRPYTISSSSKEHKKLVGVTITLLHKELEPRDDIRISIAKSSRVYEGACSSMCCRREPERVRLQIRPSQFRLPAKKTSPVIMIAAGTGVAPFRGFLREFQRREIKPDATMLFFGCQRADTDFIYSDELEMAGEYLPNYSLITAFSREQAEKMYVQHRLAEHGEAVRELLEQGAFVYVCGATEMGKDVEKTLDKIVEGAGRALSVESLRKTKRFIEELWG
eukprot:GEMP01016240.1.p1 GENE.GEMP01016240.1~~GEMP01016240.1.p1  ORF type:complete len:647 (+),score=140.80 GEMP01016240.1:126-2066(+)